MNTRVIRTLSTMALSLTLTSGLTFSMETDNLTSSNTQVSENRKFLNPYERPAYLKESIEHTFSGISSGPIQWRYNGSSSYSIMKINSEEMVKTLIKSSANGQKEFFLLDIGAGNFSWGNGTVSYINDQTDLPDDIVVHVISVTGENYGGQTVKHVGRCKQYNLDTFKIEDLHQSLLDKGLDVRDKLDLIVSRYTFIHLHDPVGTFVQAYNLLRPSKGIALMDGFPVFFGSGAASYYLKGPMVDFLIDTGIPFLVGDYGSDRGMYQFLMKRPDEKPLLLSIEYAGTVYEEVANTTLKSIAYFNRQSQSTNTRLINMPCSWAKSMVHGDYALYEWVWSNLPRWQTETTSWEPILGSAEAANKMKVKRSPPPLFDAVYTRDMDKLKKLLSAGSSVNQKNALGIPLIFTAYDKNVQEFLLSQEGFDPSATDDYGRSVLHYVKGDVLTFFLKKYKCNINAQDRRGNTPLHTVIQDARYNKKRLADVSLLLEYGADPLVQNQQVQTPFELEEAKYTPTAEIIEAYKNSTIVISNEDYKDSTGNLVSSLKNNDSVVNLTIYNNFNVFDPQYNPDPTSYKNYCQLILEGLQNKPNLQSLRIVGSLDLSLFFQESRCIGNLGIHPREFLKLPHMKFFSNLRELKVGMLMGANRNDAYFYIDFLSHLPNLEKFETTDPYYGSFERQ